MNDFCIKKIDQHITVQYAYSVLFTRDVFDVRNSTIIDAIANDDLSKNQRMFFVLEESLATNTPNLVDSINQYCQAHSDIIKLTSAPTIVIGGEHLKSFDTVLEFCELFNKNELCRHSYVAIIGGGAFLDAVGFVASIVHRGIRQIRFPTTVLSQNDSGVGVKTAINLFDKKNFLGTFAPPYAVINDFNFLNTLSQRDWVAGIPEAFKVAMIKDADFFKWLCDNSAKLANRDLKAMEYLIAHCAKLHTDHIANSGDPFEFGSARPLDFGHWAAHKLEMLTNGDLRHGEAVAIGLMIDTFYSVQEKLIDKDVLMQLKDSFQTLKLPIWSDMLKLKENGKLKLLDGIEDFREHLGGELHITLPNGLGHKIEVSSINHNHIIKAIDFLASF